ncbi:MAG: DUF350 domain-containing protein [Methanoregula sp.]
MLLANAVLGLFQLVVSVVFAAVALYIGFSIMSRITPGIDEEKELAKGNIAVAILVAAVFVAIAIIVESGVTGLSVGINKAMDVGIFTSDGLVVVGFTIIQFILGIVLAVAAIYLALYILDRLTQGIEIFRELKKGNIAVALMMAGVIIAVAVIIQSGVLGITATLI